MSLGTTYLRHTRVQLALHHLRNGHVGDGHVGDGDLGDAHLGDGPGRPLLLVHGLGERSPDRVPGFAARWPGPIFALDLTGHGESTVPLGGGYTPEILMADVDAALATLGESTIVGRGLGGYLALLIS